MTFIAGIGLIGFGIYLFFFKENAPTVYKIFCVLFGYFTVDSSWRDIQIFRNPPKEDKMWWWYHHIDAMLGSYVAAVTAFAVQSGNSLVPNWDFVWLLWLLPAVIGVPLVDKWIRQYKLKFNKVEAVK